MTAAIISVTEKALNAKDSATANMHLSVLKAMKTYQYL